MSENLRPRQSAVRILNRILFEGQTTDEAIATEKDYDRYTDSDRHFIRLLILTTLRRLGQIDGILDKLLKRPLPRKQQTILSILRLSVAQKIFLNTPDYAVVSTAVSLTRRFHFDGLAGLVNAVLRHLTNLKNHLEGLENPLINLPDWLRQSWQEAYGPTVTEQIATAILHQPPLDITVADQPETWAKCWQGQVLPTGSIRVPVSDPMALEGFSDHRCWVQNAAASVPAQLLTDIQGKRVADLCAAPGGKTAQLACRGAIVTAVDISAQRMKRLTENMTRLDLADRVIPVVADLQNWTAEPFDAVLLDAPCSATGTIARHPEIKYHRTPADISRLADLQAHLLHRAIELTKPGGEIVFSTCSLEPLEGDSVVRQVLDQVTVVCPTEERWAPYLTPFGSLRFLPSDGFDGFYACLLRRR